jgi:glutaredoxin
MRETVLTLYGRRDCHLCHEMAAALEALRAGRGFRVETVDIDVDPRLLFRYANDVPVLVAGETEICRHRLDCASLDAYLSEVR